MEKAPYQEAETHQVDYEELSPFWKIPAKLRGLGITDVFDSSNSQSDMSSADFLMALRHAKDWIENKASLYARENRKLRDLDGLLKNDPVTDFAKRFKWRGMYDDKSEYHETYLKFIAKWQVEKMEKFVELVQEYRKPRRSVLKPVAAVAAGLVALVAGAFGSYHFYIKPDIKSEIQQSMPVMPDVDSALDSMIAKMRPELRKELEVYRSEIRKELELYNEQSEENVERAIDKVLKKRGLDKLLKMLEDK
ncbi:Uncharacterised protein [uncultured archaeon]|nr:Uncharacterised protein [uncultured archaeon]